MKKLAFFILLVFSNHILATEANIKIDLTKKGPALNPAMYGIFLEEINHGVDGGLYAELIRNRAFEDSRAPEGYVFSNGRWRDTNGFDSGFSRYGYTTDGVPFWSLISDGNAKGQIYLETTGGVTEQSAYCLCLEIEDISSGRLGIANTGFFGIGIKQNEQYALSLYVRRDESFNGPISIRLEDASGNACSDSASFKDFTTNWKQFKATLTGVKTEPMARLVITAGATGKVWLDFVSLFPVQTWKSRPNGLRPDIAQMIADLKPGFVRFPGGCVVEGGTVETAYNWKLTVGPIEERQERWGPWNYRRTQGMGLYEYLQFCQDIKAEPLWVGFVGQTCIFRERENVPMEDMGWVRDGFLDIVEYANGPEDSEWGKMRAEAGHPEPFDLKYVEIGNENEGREYGERYNYVYEVMKEKYPDITYLADLSWTSRSSMLNAEYDIEDQHYYNSPRWFSGRYNEYDERNRNLPPLYLGEVAVTSNEGGPTRGNLLAALSEGVFLMGCERNSDAVRMVSYAPLLAHVDGRTELTNAPPPWHAMIYHDNLRVFGTVSYYLWKLFGTNRPSYTVAADVTLDTSGPPTIAGSVGVGTWNTSAEFKDIRVEKNGQVLYSTDFSNGAQDWKINGGRWAVENGVYRQGRRTQGISTIGEETWSDYTLSLKARKLSGDEGFLIIFGNKGNEKYWWNLGGWGNAEHAIEFNQTPVGSHVRGQIETNRWYDIKIVLSGMHIKCYLDGALVHDVTAPLTTNFFAQAGYDETSGDIIIKAINLSDEKVTSSFNINGTNNIGTQATIELLSSENMTDNNSLDEPQKVVPVTSSIDISGTEFSHEFPSRSLMIMRLKTR